MYVINNMHNIYYRAMVVTESGSTVLPARLTLFRSRKNEV